MRNATPILILAAGALFGVPACTEVDPQPGQLGGPCRVSFTPCDDGLVCNGNGCERPSGGSNPVYDVTFNFKDGKAGVEADGMDTTILTASFFQTANGLSEPAPENLQFRMWVDPPGAGTLEFANQTNPEVVNEDSRVPFRVIDSNAAATVRFTGCDKALPSCVRYANIRVSIAPDVLNPIASVPIENIGAGVVAGPVDPDNPDDPPAIPTPPLPDGFGPVERCNGVMNQIYLKGDDNAVLYQGSGQHFDIDSWALITAIPQTSTNDIRLRLESEALDAAVVIVINTVSLDEDVEVREYDPVVDTAQLVDGAAQFNIKLIQGDTEIDCSRQMERRFAVQALRVENANIQSFNMSFVHGCDGGIIEGCINITPILGGE